MAILTQPINAVFTEVGQKVVFSSIPLREWNDWSDLAFSTSGTTINRFPVYRVRYTRDGVKFTEWEDDTTIIPIIQATPFALGEREDFIVEVEVTRQGSDTTGTFTLVDIVYTGTPDPAYLSLNNMLEGTIFAEISWDDYEWNYTWMNLLRKLFHKGITPLYLDREDDLLTDDRDFITYMKVLAYFYAYIIVLGNRKIGGIYDDQFLLRNYLQQRDVKVFEEQTLVELQAVVQELFVNFRQRGTNLVADEVNPSVNQNFNGELRRIVAWQDSACDEFVFGFLPPKLYGLVVDSTSPESLSTVNHHILNKTPEDTQDFVNLALYTQTSGCTIVPLVGTQFGDIAAVRITKSSILTIGLRIGRTLPSFLGYMSVNENLAYEVSFWYMQESTTSPSLSCIMLGANCSGTSILLENANSGLTDTTFTSLFEVAQPDVWYHFRFIVLPSGAPLLPLADATPSMGGRHLRWGAGTKKASIEIRNVLNPSNFLIWDFKFRPAYLPYNSAVIDSSHRAVAYAKNNNSAFSDIALKDDIERSLLNAGTRLHMEFLT